MAKQLVYTSVPEGLWPGTSGYCTVLSTEGIPRVQAEYLEKLSVFRIADRLDGEVISPTQDNYERLLSINPSNLSHIKFRFRGHEESLLFKTCLAGFDYSSRLRKLSHFLLLSDSDQSPAGPVWLAQQPGVFLGNWGGQPNLLKQEKDLPRGSLMPASCRTWQAVMGDAGWAGVLAASVLRRDGQPVYIIADGSTDVAQLLLEASSLLPLEKRWDVTFATRYVNFTQGVTCQWRCVAPGSPEALEAVRGSANLIIDTLNPTAAPHSKEAAAARKGQQLEAETPRPATVFTSDFAISPEPASPASTDAGVAFVPVEIPPHPADDTEVYYPSPNTVPAAAAYSQPAEAAHDPLPQTGRLRLPVEKPVVEPAVSRPPPLTPADLPPHEPPIGYSSAPSSSSVSAKIVILSLLIVVCAALLGGVSVIGLKKYKEVQEAKVAAEEKKKRDEEQQREEEDSTRKKLEQERAKQQQNDRAQEAVRLAKLVPPRVTKEPRSGRWRLLNHDWVGKHASGFANHDCWGKEAVPMEGSITEIRLDDIIDDPRVRENRSKRLGDGLRIVSINNTSLDELKSKGNAIALECGRIEVVSGLLLRYIYSKPPKADEDPDKLGAFRLTVANGNQEDMNSGEDRNQILDTAVFILKLPPPRIAESFSKEFEYGVPFRFTAKELGIGKELKTIFVGDREITDSPQLINGIGSVEIDRKKGDSLELVVNPTIENDGLTPKPLVFEIAAAGEDRYESNKQKITSTIKERDFSRPIEEFLASLEMSDPEFPDFRYLKIPAATGGAEPTPAPLGQFPKELSKRLSIGLEPGTPAREMQEMYLQVAKDGNRDVWKVSTIFKGTEAPNVGEFRLVDGQLSFQWTIGDAYSPVEIEAEVRRNAASVFVKIGFPNKVRYLRFPPMTISSKELTHHMFKMRTKDEKTGKERVVNLPTVHVDELLPQLKSWKYLPPSPKVRLLVNAKEFRAHDSQESSEAKNLYLTVDDKTPQSMSINKNGVMTGDGFRAISKPGDPAITFKLECGIAGKLKPNGGKEQDVLFAIIRGEE